jgi:hypothetical protein
MGALTPEVTTISSIKAKLLQPALTSHFLCTFDLPQEVQKQLGFSNLSGDIKDTLSVSCSEASLPGSSLATHDLNNDFTGITQKHAYRRLYDDRADFTFYVNTNYDQIRAFEGWIRYISGEQIAFGEKYDVTYKVNYPDNYKGNIYITKFERDNKTKMTYTFVNSFPISINSMPVSYDSSQLLKCTVSFTYDRYIADNVSINGPTDSSTANTTNQSVPNPYNNTSLQNLDFGVKPSDLNIAPNTFNQQPTIDPSIAYNTNLNLF